MSGITDALIPKCQPAILSWVITLIGILTLVMYPHKMQLKTYAIVIAVLVSLVWNVTHQYFCNIDMEQTSEDLLTFRLITPLVLGFITLLLTGTAKN